VKIAVVGTRGFPNVQGGVETHCEKLYTHLAKRGCHVTVFTRKSYVDPKLKKYRGINLVALDAHKSKFLEAIFHTAYAIMRARLVHPDIVHIHAIGPSILAPFARALGLRVVVTNHGPDYARAKWHGLAKWLLKLSERIGSQCANRVISISGLIQEDLYNKYRVDSKVIPNGISPRTVVEEEGLLRKHDLEKHKYVLSVGRLVPEKGMHDLIDAFVASGLSRRGWKLVIVGKADHEDRYSIWLKERAIEFCISKGNV
jgi:glycosyltransferase involved in cell wall biosynthesis